jgi:hypothetical protein
MKIYTENSSNYAGAMAPVLEGKQAAPLATKPASPASGLSNENLLTVSNFNFVEVSGYDSFSNTLDLQIFFKMSTKKDINVLYEKVSVKIEDASPAVLPDAANAVLDGNNKITATINNSQLPSYSVAGNGSINSGFVAGNLGNNQPGSPSKSVSSNVAKKLYNDANLFQAASNAKDIDYISYVNVQIPKGVANKSFQITELYAPNSKVFPVKQNFVASKIDKANLISTINRENLDRLSNVGNLSFE